MLVSEEDVYETKKKMKGVDYLVEIIVTKIGDNERIELSVELGILQSLLQAALHFTLKPSSAPKIYASNSLPNDMSFSHGIFFFFP